MFTPSDEFILDEEEKVEKEDKESEEDVGHPANILRNE